MKQGRATTSRIGATKVEPHGRGVSPAAVSMIGISQGNHAADGGHTVRNVSRPVFSERGVQAPMKGQTTHHKGSQGRY
jgi:hypothetical protein